MSELAPHALGHVARENGVTVFFGDRRSERAAVEKAFPQFKFIGVNQTHSDAVSCADAPTDDPADAHWSRTHGLALAIRTADCVPVMIHDPSSGLIAAVHAGWRGIENEILLKTGMVLKKEGAALNRATAWIGPHIGTKSFEVGRDVGASLEGRYQSVRIEGATTSLHAHASSEKVYVDLALIARAQLASLGIVSLHALAIDTFASAEHASHRRDREKAGRELSFIALE